MLSVMTTILYSLGLRTALVNSQHLVLASMLTAVHHFWYIMFRVLPVLLG